MPPTPLSDVPPPALEKDDPRWPGHDARYKGLSENELPLCESLKTTIERVMPYWHGQIMPQIKNGRRILISAHGNSLRGLVKHLDNIPDSEIPLVNIPTGIPLVYELDSGLVPVSRYYLGDQDAVKEAMEAVAKQGKKR